MASSESETQNATFDWLVAGEITSTSAPSTSSPSVERSTFASTGSGVTTSSFTSLPLPPPPWGQTAPAGPPRPTLPRACRYPLGRGDKRRRRARGDPQDQHGDVVARLAPLELQHTRL